MNRAVHNPAHDLHGRSPRPAGGSTHDPLVIAVARLAEYRDRDAGGHLERVTHFCRLLALALRNSAPYSAFVTDEYLDNLSRAVPLHDIGKAGIPDRILLKPGALTPDELRSVRAHCRFGAECLRSIVAADPACGYLKMAVQIAASHHEWYNGRGYPDGLVGRDIPLSARITALADVYDALRMRRPYKPALSHERARRIILDGAGAQFDPDVVAAFRAAERGFEAVRYPSFAPRSVTS